MRTGLRSAGWARLLHLALDRLDPAIRPLARRSSLLGGAWVKLLDAVVARQPDRRYMRKAILPALAAGEFGKILFVGTRGYTRRYERAFRRLRTEYWTSDIDPEAARYGAADRHVTCDVRDIDLQFAPATFDAVVLNGVFGWGVDDPAGMDATVRSVARVLSPDGILLVGWNHDRSPDPDTLPGICKLFTPESYRGLSQRHAFTDVTHVYSWYRKRG